MGEELERKASYGLVIALSITSMVGTGMFFGPAIAASYAGNASLLAWAVLAIVSIYVGFCFAELSSMFSSVGGVYAFAKNAYGRFFSFQVGWVTWIVSSITPAVIIIAALDYLIPSQSVFVKIVSAFLLIIILNLVALRGVEASTALLIFFAFITIGVILSIFVAGIPHVNFENYVPFFPEDFSYFSIFLAVFFLVETFFGWESATFMAGETKNAQKVIPRSLLIITSFVAIMGFCFAFVILGFVPFQTLVNFDVPLRSIAFYLFGNTGSQIISVSIFLALTGSAAGAIVSSPRLILALAKDKLFIEQFSAIHKKFKTPYKAIFFRLLFLCWLF